ncbi:hypothetical protein GGR66_003017 [Xanthomonas sp. 3498]|nr:hypothetical protein [Xanthomonas sp. 3498]
MQARFATYANAGRTTKKKRRLPVGLTIDSSQIHVAGRLNSGFSRQGDFIMDSVSVEELSRDHLLHYWTIFAYAPGEEYCREVWRSLRLLPLVGADHPGNIIPVLHVQVSAISDAGIAPLIARLEQLDPGADRRIVREFIRD